MIERLFSNEQSTIAQTLAEHIGNIPLPEISLQEDHVSMQQITYAGKPYRLEIHSVALQPDDPNALFAISIRMFSGTEDVAFRAYRFEYDTENPDTIRIESGPLVIGNHQGSGIGLGLVLTTDDIITRTIRAHQVFSGKKVYAELEDGATAIDIPKGAQNFSRTGWTSRVIRQFLPEFLPAGVTPDGNPLFRKTYQQKLK